MLYVLAPQERVNHYASELGIVKGHSEKYKRNVAKHVADVINIPRSHDYHYKLYEGSADRNYKFYNPDLINDYTRHI